MPPAISTSASSPQDPDNPQARVSGLARLALDTPFHGDFDATSQGEMLATSDDTTAAGTATAACSC